MGALSWADPVEDRGQQFRYVLEHERMSSTRRGTRAVQRGGGFFTTDTGGPMETTRRYAAPYTAPRYHDERRTLAARLLSMTAKTQKAIALALGQSPSYVSQKCRGEHPAVARHLEEIDRLMDFGPTEAEPVAVSGLLHYFARQYEGATAEDLDEVERRLAQLEQEREARENVATMRWMLERDGEDELIEALTGELSVTLNWIALAVQRQRLRGSA